MPDLSDLQKRVVDFRDARDWKQFHRMKDLAIGLMLEASEFTEPFQWKSPEEITEYLRKKGDEVSEELADVLYWVLIAAHELDINLADIFEKKMQKNEKKYPIDKVKGSHRKYTEL